MNKMMAIIPVEHGPYAIAITPDGTKVYVANSKSNTVSVIATATNRVIATTLVGAQPTMIAVTPDGTKVYVGNSGIGTISVISTVTDQIVATLPVGKFNSPVTSTIVFTRC
jgi:YVTN family beta-propeller protein